MSRPLLFLIIAAVALNLIGAFIPETGFDALWYHLTIPKLYLAAGKIYHIPGGLLYYSELPRLTEILYIPLLKFFGDVGPHLLSWGAGIGVAILTYKLSRKLGLSPFFSFISSILFYTTPLVSWQSGSAYVDLFRTFFEVLALYLVLSRKFVIAGLVIGLAISTKTLALGSLPILIILVLLSSRRLRPAFFFLLSSLLISLPWFLSAYLNTGYPFYPIGAGILDTRHNLNLDIWNFSKVTSDFVGLWLFPEDPISPIYLSILPFLLLSLPKLKKFIGLLLYCFIGFIIWYVTPRTGGGRFILPYLPAWSVLVAATIAVQKKGLIKNALISLICLISLTNLGYRLFAISKAFPHLLGHQTKTGYLCQNLDTKTAFVDCDGWFTKNLRPTDTVLVSGYHNLFYINFPFIHESWYRGEKFTYLLKP